MHWSGSIRIGRVNHQFERPAVGHSKRGEVTHVSGGDPTNAEALCERHNRSVHQAKAEVRVLPVNLHGP